MKTFRFLLLFGFMYTIFIFGLNSKPVSAATSYGWAPDEKVPGYLDDTFTPFLLADRNRTVHAFASQWVENNGRRLAIVYRQWSLMGGWTRPVDIILAPVGDDANFMGAYMDSSDMIHVIFTATENLQTNVYYSSAPAVLADWAPAWSTPVLVGDSAIGLNSGAIIGDDQGNIIIIYSGSRDGAGVYYVLSKDSGRKWSASLPVFLTYDSNLSAFSLRLAIGPEQKIRAAWSVVTNLGVDKSLYFSSFDTQTSKWDTPVELDKRIELPDYFGPSFPSIVDNGQEIVIVYNGGNPFTGRPVDAGRPIQRARISMDGGRTWNEPLSPFPFHVGRSGEHVVVLDGNAIPHTLFVQRIESQNEDGKTKVISGIWHSEFVNNNWTNPDRIVTQLAPHDVRATVVQGNVILTVWREDPGSGADGVWYSYSVLDIPELPVVPLATASIDYSIQGVATAIPALTLSTPEALPSLDTFNEKPPSNLGDNPALPIVVGVVPVVLILLGVILGYRYFLQRRE
jgi:hypothetical protein